MSDAIRRMAEIVGGADGPRIIALPQKPKTAPGISDTLFDKILEKGKENPEIVGNFWEVHDKSIKEFIGEIEEEFDAEPPKTLDQAPVINNMSVASKEQIDRMLEG
jgi:hypothetical protein